MRLVPPPGKRLRERKGAFSGARPAGSGTVHPSPQRPNRSCRGSERAPPSRRWRGPETGAATAAPKRREAYIHHRIGHCPPFPQRPNRSFSRRRAVPAGSANEKAPFRGAERYRPGEGPTPGPWKASAGAAEIEAEIGSLRRSGRQDRGEAHGLDVRGRAWAGGRAAARSRRARLGPGPPTCGEPLLAQCWAPWAESVDCI